MLLRVGLPSRVQSELASEQGWPAPLPGRLLPETPGLSQPNLRPGRPSCPLPRQPHTQSTLQKVWLLYPTIFCPHLTQFINGCMPPWMIVASFPSPETHNLLAASKPRVPFQALH